MTNQEALNLRVEHYMDLLRHLETNVKLALIAKLSASVVEEAEETPKADLDDLFGAWVPDDAEEDLAETIRNSRTFNREIEPF